MTSAEAGGRAVRRYGGMSDGRSGGAWVALTVAFIAACMPGPRAPAPANPLANVPRAWPLFDGAEEVSAANGMVVSSHPLASQVGTDIMRRGGNAVDAAVAVGFALTVVHARAGNIGGGGFMVIRSSRGDVVTIDYREVAPAGGHSRHVPRRPGQGHRGEFSGPPGGWCTRKRGRHGRGTRPLRSTPVL